MIDSGIEELVNLVKACPRSAKRIVDCMCRLCKIIPPYYSEVVDLMSKVAALCPTKAADIVTTVLHCSRHDFYAEEANETGKTREEVVTVAEDGRLWDNAWSSYPHDFYYNPKTSAMHQLGQSTKLVPHMADEALEALFSCLEYECYTVRRSAIWVMGNMIKVCPEKAEEMVTAMLLHVVMSAKRSELQQRLDYLSRPGHFLRELHSSCSCCMIAAMT